MRERPILFSGAMVRALLEGRKTQTRRVVTPQPTVERGGYSDGMVGHEKLGGLFAEHVFGHCMAQLVACLYGAPGDRLWVREGWQLFDDSPEGEDLVAVTRERLGPAAPWKGCQGDRSITWRAAYRADGELEHPVHGRVNWRPSIHMPRWASRITLEVTGVRVERLQAISADDARAEGVDGLPPQGGSNEAQWRFRSLWDGINGKRAPWASNPWVWVVEFRRVEAP